MGGESTEVSSTTTDVLIEAAHFDAVSIARSARRHKLPSEASRRFERGVDPELGPAAAQLAVDLLVRFMAVGRPTPASPTWGGARVVDHSDGRRLPDPARRRRLRPHHRAASSPRSGAR